MISINEVKKGVVIKLDGDIWVVTKSEQVKPGKGSAFTRAKLKSITKGQVIEKTFKEVDKIEDVDVEKRKMTYSYDEGENFVFMDSEDYEEHRIDREMLGDVAPFLPQSIEVDVQVYEGKAIAVTPPNFVELEVTYAEEGLKGDTTGTARKKVSIETGGEINVPIFVKQGDRIKIDLRDISYVERVK